MEYSLLEDLTHFFYNKWLSRFALATLIVVSSILLFRIINRLHIKIRRKIVLLKGSKFKGITIKNYRLLDEEKEQRIILFSIRYFKYLLYISVAYTSITLLLGIFPLTNNLSHLLVGYVLTPLKTIALSIVYYLPNLVKIFIIIVIFYYLMKFLRFIAKEIQAERIKLNKFYPDWAVPTFGVVKILLIIFCMIQIFPLLPGADSDTFKGISIFAGIILSLGSTNLIGNIVAGVVITYMRPFQIGDMIKIGDVTGNVVDKTPFVVRIRTQKMEEITIPNSQLLTNHTINYTRSASHTNVIIYSTIRISYDKQWEQIYELLIRAAEQTPFVLQEPKPFVQQVALNKVSVEYQINAYINEVNKLNQIYSDLHQNIQSVFKEAGIELLSPEFLINGHMGNSTK